MSELTEMEKYLQKLFTEAGQDLKKKFLKYTQDFQRLDAAKQQAVEDGNITEDEYKEWRKNKLLYGMHWQRLIDRNTAELLKYNQTAIKYINGEVPQIFASGYNHVAEQIPDSPVAGFDFELINADTVNNLVHEDGIILPPKKKVDPEKDKAWNAKLINAQLLQGIMQGESIPDMAKRMMTVANSDLAGATRTARTMHTAAQNAGRQSGYNKAAQQGIIFEKTWISARQINRTRDTHYALHGTTIPYNEKFLSDSGEELEFPGDWRAAGFEVYNCRCTLITKFKGFKKLNGEEPEPHTRHEEPEKQEKTAVELGKGTKTLMKYFKKYFDEAQLNEFMALLTGNEAENRWIENLTKEKVKWKKGKSCKWDGDTVHWKLDDSPTKKDFTTIFHEAGHAIDQFMGKGNYSANEIETLRKLGCVYDNILDKRSTTDEFLAAVRKDKDALIKLIQDDAGALYKDLQIDHKYTNGIQDFISGIYGYDNSTVGLCEWAHSEDYWNRLYRFCQYSGKRQDAADYYNSIGIEVKNADELRKVMRDYESASELWAHLNATYAYGGENYEMMNKYCPNAMKAFRKMMEEQP